MLRLPLAALIAARRARGAAEIYEKIGGGSPMLPNTEAQARALEGGAGRRHQMLHRDALLASADRRDRRARSTAWRPDEVVLLPLYPQYSTTTTGSSHQAWQNEAGAAVLAVRPDRPVVSDSAWVSLPALASWLEEALVEVSSRKPRLLLSAHGLPLKTCTPAIPIPARSSRQRQAHRQTLQRPGIAWRVCYQSRVGPLEWLGPRSKTNWRSAAQDRVPVDRRAYLVRVGAFRDPGRARHANTAR